MNADPETPGPVPDDDALMRAFALGDAEAFDELYARHRAALYRFLHRLLGSAGRAHVDEVFQDTWLRVVQSRQRWAPQGAAFRTWLFTVAHHRAMDVWRRHGREVSRDATAEDGEEPWQPEDEAWSGWPVASDAPADHAFWRAAGQRLLSCLDELPPAQRAVFLLHHEEGLALETMASQLDAGFETVKSRLRYAMAKLRVCMGAYLPASEALPAAVAPRRTR
jgi:RNA polymerase sigma factor (sigma-70 family)